MRSAGAPTASRPVGSPRISPGLSDIARNSWGSERAPEDDQPQARRQHGLDADRARRGFAERQALGLDVLRIVIGDDDVDQPLRQRSDEFEPFGLAAQRREHFQEGAIVADVVLVEGQIVDRDARADLEPAFFARSSASSDSALETSAAW